MADSNTPNIGLLIADTADVVQYPAHIGNNLTTIDGLMGAVDCTSVTRPTNTYKGQIIYEHDTGRYVQNTRTKAAPVWSYMSHQALVENSSALPTGGLTAGELIYLSDLGALAYYSGSAWHYCTLIVCSSTTRPTGAALQTGTFIYETDTQTLLVWTGSGWAHRSFNNFVCTSSTHPSWAFQGLEIYETDTGLAAVYSGSNYLYGLQQLAPTQSVSAAANVTFSGLPAVNRLLVVWRLRSSTSGTPLGLQIDGDSTSGHYIWAKMTARAAATSASGNTGDVNAQIGTVAGSSTANYFSSGETFINGWNSTNGYCNMDSVSSCWDTTSSYWIDKMGSLYVGTAAAHTSLKIAPGSGTLTGEVTVYGGP